jgi:hypothetical protein
VQVEVDTGSAGLVIPITQVNVANIGQPTGKTGVMEYGNWAKFYYTVYNTSVDFGNGIVTAPTDIGVITTAYESTDNGQTWTEIPQSEWSDPKYAISADMGVGAYTNSSGLASPVRALPQVLGDGLLMNVPGSQATFGANPLTGVTSFPGWWYTTLGVQVAYGGTETPVQTLDGNVTVDSGGLGGSIPKDALPSSLSGYKEGDLLPVGTTISYYAPDGQTLLFTVTVTKADYDSGNSPSVWAKDLGANTGIYPFLQGPLYFSYSPEGTGTTTFDYAPTVSV